MLKQADEMIAAIRPIATQARNLEPVEVRRNALTALREIKSLRGNVWAYTHTMKGNSEVVPNEQRAREELEALRVQIEVLKMWVERYA